MVLHRPVEPAAKTGQVDFPLSGHATYRDLAASSGDAFELATLGQESQSH
jgi:hypothetical protein